jgi:hypothetical protein
MGKRLLTLALVLLAPAVAWAQGRVGSRAVEGQIKPSLGVTFGGGTSFFDLEKAAGHPKLAFGVNGVLLGDVIGIEGDFGRTPGYFEYGETSPGALPLVAGSSVTTLTGGLVVAMPRHLTEYTLRPYFVVGAGLMRVRIDHVGVGDTFTVASNLPALEIGGGVTAFFTDRIGVSWDIRHFGSFGNKIEVIPNSFGPEQLSFWRASMALAIRY